MPELKENFCDLMRQVREGSEDAAWELVNRFGESIRRAVRRALNEKMRSKFDSLDFVQLVWGSLFRVRDKLDQFERPEHLAAYLVAMARHKVGMEIRRQMIGAKRNLAREQSLDRLTAQGESQLVSRQPMPAEVAIARERWNNLLRDQPRHYRKIILLRLRGYTYQGIADAVHLDECTVRRFLKKLLHATVK
jgi:RNA polymerase sigma-70 factor (ECF subfamily)